MRIGLFGGTFDPPHCAHTMAMLWALQSGELDRLFVIPTARHAFGKEPAASFEHRLEMCRLAIRDFAAGLVQVTPIEAERDGTSFMIDTVRQLEGLFPGTQWRLVVGTDVAGELPKWRESGELLRVAPPLVVPRLIEDGSAPAPGALPMLSSSLVRARALSGDGIDALVPMRVVEYIEKNKLYKKSG